MKKAFFGFLLIVPLMALADSAWHASSNGPVLQNRGSQVMSPSLNAAEPASGSITQIAWRYQLSGPAPSGMVVWLCAQTRCVEIEGANGTTRGLTNVNAAESLHFVYGVQGKGRLALPVSVISNEVMVNYR